MGFLKRLFGGGEKDKKKSGEYVDTRGVYFYVRCNNCGTITRVRADKEYDLIREPGGYVWHKTVVDNRCFRPMQTVVHLDESYEMTGADISGGAFVSEANYEQWLRDREAARQLADAPDASEEEE